MLRVDAVPRVARVALDVALGGEQLLPALLDLEVDVRRAAGVRDRLDGAEVVLAGRAGQEPAEALEVLVLLVLLLVAVGRVQVDALGVALPDLDQGVADRVALGVEDPAGQVGDLADGRGDAVVDDEQVVVGVERELVRVERPLGLGRGAGQLLGEQPAGGEQAETPRVPRNSRRFGTRMRSLIVNLASEGGRVAGCCTRLTTRRRADNRSFHTCPLCASAAYCG